MWIQGLSGVYLEFGMCFGVEGLGPMALTLV